MDAPRRFIFPIALLALVAAAPLRAQAPVPLVTDRPDQTESASVVPAGFVQVELGAAVTQEDEGGVRVRELAAPGTIVRIGVGQRLEARAGFAGWLRNERRTTLGETTESGIGDLAFGFKYRMRDGEGLRPSIALVATVTLPTAEEGFGHDKLQPTVLLAATHQLTDQVGLGYNVGAAWTTVSAATGSVTLVDIPYTVALGVSVTERVGAFAESFGSVGLSGGGPARHSVDVGLTFLVRPNLQLDVSGGLGLDADAADRFLAAGASLRLPR